MGIVTVVSALAALSWFGVFVTVGLIVFRTTRRQSTKSTVSLLIFIVVLALALNITAAGLVFIQPDERGVVISIQEGGIRPDALEPGLHWVIPFAESVRTYTISSQTYTMSIAQGEGEISGDDSVESRTSDGQVVNIDASVIFKIDTSRVVDKIHIEWQGQYVDRLVRPQVRGVIRDAVSQYAIEQVYGTERANLASQIEQDLAGVLEEGGLVLVNFVLRNVAFSPEYSASVERKQIAEQESQQAIFVVELRIQEAEQARQQAQGVADARVINAQAEADAVVIAASAEAQAILIKAQAEAEALLLLGEAIRANPNVLTLQYIDKLSPGIRVMLLPSDNPFLLPLPDDITP